jgi:hypothetical protein
MDDAEARAILREHGEAPPARGKLGADWTGRAETYRQGPGTPAPPGDDYDGGVTEDDFTTVAADPPEPAPLSERKPRRVRAATGTRPSIRERFTKATRGQQKPKRKQPRLSVAPLIGELWAVMGGMATRVDVPLGRCLQMQSPVAGDILEDVVKGTFVDAALQPIARAEDKAKAVAALALPPALVVALEHASTLPDEQRKLREAFLWPMLVQSMMLWERVAGDKMEAMMNRAEAEAPSRERAEAMARLIFQAPVTEPAAPEPETVDA